MKKCYITGEEITIEEAVRVSKSITAMTAVDEEFETFVTDELNLIRCSGPDEAFFTEAEVAEHGLPEELAYGVILSAAAVMPVFKKFMEIGTGY